MSKFHEPFSPTIMETEVPKKFIDIVNKVGDEVLSDDKKSAQWDWSNHLVGKVHKEVQIPIVNKEDGDYCKDVMKSMCVEYLKNMISKILIFPSLAAFHIFFLLSLKRCIHIKLKKIKAYQIQQ